MDLLRDNEILFGRILERDNGPQIMKATDRARLVSKSGHLDIGKACLVLGYSEGEAVYAYVVELVVLERELLPQANPRRYEHAICHAHQGQVTYKFPCTH